MVRHPLFVSALALAAAACTVTSSSSPDGGGPSTSDDGGAQPEGGGQTDGGGDASDGGGGDASKCTPATGYEQVAAPDPTGTQDDAHIATVIDDAGNPMVAYIEYDMAGTTLYFTAYDGATCKWKPRVKIAAVGGLDYTRDREVTMTRDPSNGRLAIGYEVVGGSNDTFSSQVWLAQSADGGATWASEMVAQKTKSQSGEVYRPTVAMSNGKTYFAYFQDWLLANSGSNPSDDSGFVLGVRSGTSGSFALTNIPAVGDTGLPGADPYPPSLAIDASGNAGLAFLVHTSDSSQNLRLVYYTTSTNKSVAVFDSLGTQNDAADVSLAFEGLKPRIGASLQRGDADASNSKVWFSDSNDGATWSMPVEMPLDQGDDMGPWISIAADGKGALTIATYRGGGNGLRTCGSPKISTSGDDGTSWTTCGPTLQPNIVDSGGRYVQVYYQPSGKRIAGFGVAGAGVYVWREP